jgi:hypothetical protein
MTIRILWLSNPEAAVENIFQSVSSWGQIRAIISRFSSEAYEILGWDTPQRQNWYSSSTALLPTNYVQDMQWLKFINNIYFQKLYAWYIFDHTFLIISQKDTKDNARFIWCIQIDSNAISQSQEEIWKKLFKQLEKSLWILFCCMNHDPTTHNFWMALDSDTTWCNRILENELWFKEWITEKKKWVNWFSSQELASATFHRDMFEHIDELWIPLKEILLKHTRIILEIMSQFNNPRLSEYFNKVIKYPLFSLINPESDIIHELRNQYHEFDLEATEWAKLIHRTKISCSVIWEYGKQSWTIDIRTIRQSMMPFYHSQKRWIDRVLPKILEENMSQ